MIITENGELKLRAKRLILGNTAKLFFISAFSILIRWTLIVGITAAALYFYMGPHIETLYSEYGKLTVLAVSGAVFAIIRFLFALVASGIRLGEQYVYFEGASKRCISFKKMFLFMSPKKSAGALSMYTKINIYKGLWAVALFLPSVLGAAIIYVLCYGKGANLSAVYALAAGTIALIIVASFVYGAIRQRYSAAPYIALNNQKIKPNEAIKLSTELTDGGLLNGVMIRLSLTGWALAGITGIGLFYVLPYFKMLIAVVIKSSAEKATSPNANSEPPVRLLHLKGIIPDI